jgi:hypothetical protein
MGLIRYIILGVIIYVAVNILKKVIAISGSQDSTKKVDSNDDVIEICPECGKQKGKKHKC